VSLDLSQAARATGGASGRYRIFFQGDECGEERWSIAPHLGGLVASGAQETLAPHPFPNRHEYRATLGADGRLTGLEIHWTVGPQRLVATHHAEAGMWRARIEFAGHVKEQHGDYPEFCEVDYATHLMSWFMLARRDFAVGGEHEFPVLRIGPPYMAVSPERMRLRCVEAGWFEAPFGRREAKRYVVSLPPRPEDEGYSFWADVDGVVLESYEDVGGQRPWMRLVELERP
jgi:hypothetical protein